MLEEGEKSEIKAEITTKHAEVIKEVIFDAIENQYGSEVPDHLRECGKVSWVEFETTTMTAEVYIPPEDRMLDVIIEDVPLT